MDSWQGKRGSAVQGSGKNWTRYSLCDQATPSSNRRASSREHALPECGGAGKSRRARHTSIDIAGTDTQRASNKPILTLPDAVRLLPSAAEGVANLFEPS